MPEDPMEVDSMEQAAPLSPSEQREAVGKVADWNDLQPNTKWFLVASQWWNDWKSFVGYDDAPADAVTEGRTGSSSLLGVAPGPIDNKALLATGETASGELVPRLIEGVDYSLVPAKAWALLKEWYGGGPDIGRGVIRAGGMVGGVLQVEVYPLVLVVEKRTLGEPQQREMMVSKKETVRNLLITICAALWLPPTSTNLYLQVDRYEYTALTDMKRTLDSYYVMSGQRLLVDTARFDGSYLGPPERPLSAMDAAANDQSGGKGKGDANPYYRQMSGKYVSSTRGLGMAAMWKDSTEAAEECGVTGLVNLGNTCFMSCSIQCLSNVPQFSSIFRADEEEFAQLLNRDNPMGTGGKLAEEFWSVIRKIWSGNHTYIAPKDLKYTLGNFAPQFSGYRQHDAQELLAFLLDGLHEDLNHVVEKPYFADQLLYTGDDVTGPEATAVGEESWRRHLARNKSKIVDLFDGLLRSQLHCPKCDRVSLTFDPFRYLSVPIPNAEKCSFDVTFVPCSHLARPQKYRVEASIHGTVKDLHRELARMAGVPFGSIIFAHELRNSIRSFVRSDSKGLGALENFDSILAFEAVSPPADYETPADAQPAAKPAAKAATHPTGEKSAAPAPVDECSIEARIPEGRLLLQFLFRSMVDRVEEGSGGAGEVELVGLPLVRCVAKSASHAELMGTVAQYLALYGGPIAGERSEITAKQSPKSASEEAYAFSLRVVTANGRRCAVCKPTDPCLGCALEELPEQELKNGQSIAVDLHTAVAFSDAELDGSMTNASGNEEDATPMLEECLALFSEAEVLLPGQEWFCPHCKAHVCATKQLGVWRWPSVLIIHFKRFYHLQGSNKRGKVEKEVRYPLVLTTDGGQYKLVAVSNHMGGIGGGHYTAFAKNELNQKWYEFNDRACSELQPERLQTEHAYILYYVHA